MKAQSVATALNQVREARNSTSRDKQQQFDLSQVATQGPEGEQKFAEKGIYDEDISPQFQRYFDSGYNNLQVDLDAIYIPEPPADASQSTRMELEELDTLVQEAKLPPGIMQVADKDPLRLFYSVAKKKGLEPLEQEAREWADDWTKLSFEYKMKFKRRRPWEVKKEHDIDFVVNKSDTTESPSYPSGHAMMGYGVAEFYKDTYPLMSDEWDNIADIIAHSRLQMGVHYPSDVEASKKIVAQVSSSTKQANMASDAFNKVKSAINKDVLKTYRKSKTPLAHLKKVKKFLGNEALEAYDRAETGYDIIDEIMRGRHFLPATLLKFSSEYSPRTISEQGWAEEEHSNTKVPRWFRESAMQEAIADELGFTEESAPTFHKDQNPELQGRNAYYDPTLHQIHYDTGDWTPGVLAHEIGHSTMDISPTAKAFNLAKDLTQVSTLPLALAASSMKINPRSPTLMRALKSSGGVAGKLKALVEGAKGRGGRWALGASALAGLGTVLEEARASSKGYSGIDRLVEDGIMSEEQGELAKGTMKGAFGTYLMGTPINVGAGIIGHKLLGGAARKLLPNKVRLGLAGTMGALSAGSILAAHLGGYRNVADNPLFGKTELLNNPLHELNTKTSSYTTKESRAALKNLTKLTKGLRTSSPATMAIEQGTRKAGKKTKNLALRAWTHPKAMELSHKAQDWFTPAHNEVGSWGMSPIWNGSWGMPPIWKKFGSVKHLEQRRLERAKFMSQDDLARLEKQVSRAKDLPEGANYITLPHGRKGVIRTEEGRSFLATILDARMRPPGSNISSKVKTAADKLRLYHGSPSDLGALEPRQPNKGNWGDPGVYGSPDPLVAALYAIARNESRGSWGVTTDGKLIARSKKELNPEGYVYGYDSDDYIAPPEDDLGIGYASQNSPEILSKEKVYLDNLRDSITRVDGRDKFLEYFKKTSEDRSALNVLTAVPKQNLDLIMRKGLYSQKAMLDDPEVMAAFLAQRNADKAWKDDEQYDEKRFKEQYDKRLLKMEGRDAPLAGPSVFFTEPDPDKVSDPRHFINQFDTQKLRVNLAKLLQDIPETRIQGAELLPFLPEHHDISDEEWDVIAKQRQRDLSPEEVAKYIGTDSKELWEHYPEEAIGKQYAANVPHAFIRTPSGIIPPEYLEQIEKTSSAMDRLKGVLTKESNLVRQATTGFNTLVKSTARGASNVGGKVKQFKQNHVDALKSIPINKKTITSPSGQTHTFTRTLQDNANINKFRKYRQRRAGARGTTLPARQPLNTSIAREAVKNPNYRRDVGHYVAAAPGVAPAVGAMSAGAQFVDDIGGVIGKFANHSSAKEHLKHILIKTGAYKDYRPRGTLYLLDGKGGVMADKPTESYGSTTPYHFPGGGIFEEEKIDRLPTAQEVTEGIEREALEELGTKLKNVRMLQDQPVNIDMPDWWRERQRKKRGLDYKGIAEFYAAAERGDLDKSIYGADNDEFRGTYYPIEEVAKSIEDSVKPGDEHYDMSTGQARLLRSLLEKTSSDQPLLRHRSTLLIRDPESGKLLAANNREDRNFSDVSPFYFPGGGLYDDEYDTPRTPTEEEILEGARREALEELGMTLNNPRVISSTPHLLTQKAWRDKALRHRGAPYEGGHEHLVLADKGNIDNSLYNVEGDAFTKGDYYDPQEVYDSLYDYGQQEGQFSAYNREQAKAIKEHLLGKVN